MHTCISTLIHTNMLSTPLHYTAHMFFLFDARPPYPLQLYLRTATLLMECDNDGNVEIITLRPKGATGSVTRSTTKQSSRRFIMALKSGATTFCSDETLCCRRWQKTKRSNWRAATFDHLECAKNVTIQCVCDADGNKQADKWALWKKKREEP